VDHDCWGGYVFRPWRDLVRGAPRSTRSSCRQSATGGGSSALGPFSLTAIGIASVVGGGIFVTTGVAASQHAGPAVVISFVFAGIVALVTALCYAELASMIPAAGSTYSYVYAAFGIFPAWFIGWDLLLEYLFAASAVAVGWSGYAVSPSETPASTFPTHSRTRPLGPAPGSSTCPRSSSSQPPRCFLSSACGNRPAPTTQWSC
jgi:amino acid transporter